jgi:hypothetical protein
MTSSGNYRIGMLKCQENYEELKVPFEHLASIKNEIQREGLIHNNKHYNIKFKWGSDWMLEAELNGLKGPTSNHPCLVCVCHKKDFDNIDLHNEIMNDPKRRKHYVRSLESQKVHLKFKKEDDKKGYKRESILQMEHEDFVKDMLHLKMGMHRGLFAGLFESLADKDKYDTSSNSTLCDIKHPYLTKWLRLLQDCAIQIKPKYSGDKIFRDLRGGEIDQLFRELTEGTLIKMFPDVKNIHYIDLIWTEFWKIYQAVISNTIVHSRVAEHTHVWLNIFCSVYPVEYVTPYIHYFACHMHEQVLLHGDINLYNEQGKLFIS